MDFTIRRFEKNDAAAVSGVIIKTAEVCNARDYPPRYIKDLKNAFQPEDVIRRASWTHFYVIETDGEIIGCGAIGPYWDSLTESCLFTIFILPEYQGRGLGRRLIETLEADELALRAVRIEVHASITARGFYKAMGYAYKDGAELFDEKDMVWHMEKFPRNGG